MSKHDYWCPAVATDIKFSISITYTCGFAKIASGPFYLYKFHQVLPDYRGYSMHTRSPCLFSSFPAVYHYLSQPKRGFFHDLSPAFRLEKCRRKQSPRHDVAYASYLWCINRNKLRREGNMKNTIPAQPYGQT